MRIFVKMDTSTFLEEMEYTTIDDVEKMGAKALISEKVNLYQKLTFFPHFLDSIFQIQMYSIIVKIIVMVSMFAVTFLFGLIPLKLFSAVRENTDVTSRIRYNYLMSDIFSDRKEMKIL